MTEIQMRKKFVQSQKISEMIKNEKETKIKKNE